MKAAAILTAFFRGQISARGGAERLEMSLVGFMDLAMTCAIVVDEIRLMELSDGRTKT